MALVALAVLTTVLFVAGFTRNAQQSSLAHHGVPVTVTVTSCLGEVAGSGSNIAGYACTGTYVVDGRRYTESIPGNTLLRSGSTIRGITVLGDPGLLSTPGAVATQKATWTVFIVPTILLIVLLAAVAIVMIRRKR